MKKKRRKKIQFNFQHFKRKIDAKVKVNNRKLVDKLFDKNCLKSFNGRLKAFFINVFTNLGRK